MQINHHYTILRSKNPNRCTSKEEERFREKGNFFFRFLETMSGLRHSLSNNMKEMFSAQSIRMLVLVFYCVTNTCLHFRCVSKLGGNVFEACNLKAINMIIDNVKTDVLSLWVQKNT